LKIQTGEEPIPRQLLGLVELLPHYLREELQSPLGLIDMDLSAHILQGLPALAGRPWIHYTPDQFGLAIIPCAHHERLGAVDRVSAVKKLQLAVFYGEPDLPGRSIDLPGFI